ncbi:Nucleic acid-binding, OB-fold [Cynara cardunculus var. scolymus]|uniref:Nucleic acid-binding, OB-fold n=1 Tax=Cynara cardunculus var. scolymus TaxID=59895 RepID=A0A103XU52_CYNCS|nr:Nucleic acid-binding, OB-fold [Cynara cardunculus var. scolymus]
MHQEDVSSFQLQLKKAIWILFLFRVGVHRTEYNNVKRQKINVNAIIPVNFAADTRLILEDISLMKSS